VIIDFNAVEIYLKPGPTDMRKQIQSLAVYVSDEIKGNPLSGNLYIFCGKNRKLMKVLYWDRNGFCLWQKRLEKDRFPWPRDEGEVRTITRDQLMMILSGIDFFKAHEQLFFSAVS
jgi:transposase